MNLRDKYVYVDIDGTLAEYRFNDHVGASDGSDNGMTLKEAEEHVFLRSRPLKSVIKKLETCGANGIWVCGALMSVVELQDKAVWLEKNCKGIDFSGYFWFVADEYWYTFAEFFGGSGDDLVTEYGLITRGSKNLMWDWILGHNLHRLEETVFIDDVLAYLRYAERRGVTAYHISSLMK